MLTKVLCGSLADFNFFRYALVKSSMFVTICGIRHADYFIGGGLQLFGNLCYLPLIHNWSCKFFIFHLSANETKGDKSHSKDLSFYSQKLRHDHQNGTSTRSISEHA